MSTTFQSPPENRADVMENIYTFLNMNTPDIYQFLANGVNTDNYNSQQVFGRVSAKAIQSVNGKTVYSIGDVDFKLVSILHTDSTYCRIGKAAFERLENGISLKVFLEAVAKPHQGIDFSMNAEFTIESGERVDVTIIPPGETEFSTVERGGFPCGFVPTP